VIVVDASVVVEVLLRTPAGRSVEDRLFAARESLHAPHLIDVEVVQVLRRLAAIRGGFGGQWGERLSAMARFPLTRYRHDLLLARIWELRHNLSAYDAAYVALAEVLAIPLVTRDQRLAAAPGHRAKVEVL
jgi:predicted nucleic acid-binding protein